MSETPKAKKLPSPRERLDLILLGLARRESATELCRQAGVSRELFYRWMRAVREAGLKALEAKAPGPKRLRPEKAEATALRLEERVKRQEQELRSLRRETERWKLLAKVSRRIIQRNAWGPPPEPRDKKNGMRSARRVKGISAIGKTSATPAPQPRHSPGAGGCREARTGGGLPGASEPFGEQP